MCHACHRVLPGPPPRAARSERLDDPHPRVGVLGSAVCGDSEHVAQGTSHCPTAHAVLSARLSCARQSPCFWKATSRLRRTPRVPSKRAGSPRPLLPCGLGVGRATVALSTVSTGHSEGHCWGHSGRLNTTGSELPPALPCGSFPLKHGGF